MFFFPPKEELLKHKSRLVYAFLIGASLPFLDVLRAMVVARLAEQSAQ